MKFFVLVIFLATVPAYAAKYAATKELLRTIDFAESSTKSAMTALKSGLGGQIPPSALPELEQILRKLHSSPEMQEKICAIYEDIYTEAEIKELVKFYGTPVGKKTLDSLPTLIQKSSTVMQEEIKKTANTINALLVKHSGQKSPR